MKADAPIVLVVEDDFVIRLHTINMLEAAGFATLEATNADEAIAMLESRDDVRVVLTDVDMPGSMNGLKLAHAVRKKWPPVKLILVSGKQLLATHELPEGALFYGKPYSTDEITAGIDRLMAT